MNAFLFANRYYRVYVNKKNGLFELIFNGIVLIDRGALNEYFDVSAGGFSDVHRDLNHYLQLYCEITKFEIEDFRSERRVEVKVSGVLLTKHRKKGAMSFDLNYSFYIDRPYFTLEVSRKYLSFVKCVADDSICFIAPKGVETYSVYSPCKNPYMFRFDNTAYIPVVLDDQKAPFNTEMQRVMARTPMCGWGDMSGDVCGIGVILVEKHSDVLSNKLGSGNLNKLRGEFKSEGVIRVTHPRKPHFSEIELEWMKGGQRLEGLIETAKFVIYPHRNGWEETEKLYKSLRIGYDRFLG